MVKGRQFTHSPNWRCMVNYRLKQGLGVEDIAVDLGCDVDAVRFHVRSLRKSGDLMAVLFGRKIADGHA